MGFLNRMRGKSMQDPARGQAKVLQAADRHDVDALVERRVLRLVVEAEGLEPTEVEWKGMVRADKRPRPGVVLPVTVDRANPENVEIHWDEAPNRIKQMIGGTMSDLTQEQRDKTADIQAKALEHHEELLRLAEQFKNGEIDADELNRRTNELTGMGGP